MLWVVEAARFLVQMRVAQTALGAGGLIPTICYWHLFGLAKINSSNPNGIMRRPTLLACARVQTRATQAQCVCVCVHDETLRRRIGKRTNIQDIETMHRLRF